MAALPAFEKGVDVQRDQLVEVAVGAQHMRAHSRGERVFAADAALLELGIDVGPVVLDAAQGGVDGGDVESNRHGIASSGSARSVLSHIKPEMAHSSIARRWRFGVSRSLSSGTGGAHDSGG
jgi:hypothetical protein